MYLNEANAALRVIELELLALNSAPLTLSHVFTVGDFTIIHPDGTIANTANLPTPVAGAQDGTFRLQLTQAEVSSLGSVRIQVSAQGVTNGIKFLDVFERVELPPLLVAATMDPNHINALASTFQQQWNLLMAWIFGPGDNLYGPAGSVGPMGVGDGSSTRAEWTMAAGKRRFTKLDGT